MRTWPLGMALSVCAVLFVACGQGGADAPRPEEIAPEQAGPGAIEVVQKEFAFGVSAVTKESGRIEFKITNAGTEHHEFVIVPVRDGRYGMPAGEVEAFDPGEQRAIRLTLAPGRYALVCLLGVIRPAGAVSHLSLGMIAPFEVTDG